MRPLLIITLFLSTLPFAQAMNSLDLSDPQAKQMLDAVKNNILSESSWTFDFELLVNFPQLDQEKVEGQLKQDGDKVRADLGSQLIISDGSTVWTYLKDFNEVQISHYEKEMSELFLSPAQIVQIYESGEYRYQYSGSREYQGQMLDLIEFVPTEPGGSEFVKINLWLDMDSKVPTGVMINARNGTRYNLYIKDHRKGVNHSADVFTFNADDYPGVEIDDLRF